MRQIRLSSKLLGGFGLMALIVLTVGFMSWYGSKNNNTITTKMLNHQEISKQLLQREIDHLNWAIKVGQFQRDETITALGVEIDAHNCAFGKWYYGTERQEVETAIPAIKELLGKIAEPHQKLHQSAQELEKILKKGPEFRKDAVNYYGSETSLRLKEVQVLLKETVATVMQQVKDLQAEVKARITRNTLFTFIVMILGTLCALVFGFFLSRSINKPLEEIAKGMDKNAAQMASTAGQIAFASQQLAEGASEQAASIEETSSSLEEMASMTSQNASNAGQADTYMKETGRVIEQANAAMTELTASMQAIFKASEETSKIIKTIDEIAFQTNLLALNAAVEAARAGEAGAGFAVVADEVRSLALRAAEAAKNTSGLIESIVTQIKSGTELVNKTNAAFSDVAKGSVKIAALVREIAAASGEQAQGISQLNQAVNEMDKVIQQNAASAEENAGASQEMTGQSEELNVYVNKILQLIRGSVRGDT
jgi:methyl-accepting chemotaxis protein